MYFDGELKKGPGPKDTVVSREPLVSKTGTQPQGVTVELYDVTKTDTKPEVIT